MPLAHHRHLDARWPSREWTARHQRVCRPARSPARRLEHDDEVRFGDGLAVDRRGRRRPRHAAVPPAERHVQLEPIAGNDLSPELGVVDAPQPRAGVRRLCPSASRSVATCTSDSIMSTPGMSGVPGKVSLESTPR